MPEIKKKRIFRTFHNEQMENEHHKDILQTVKGYFNASDDKEDEQVVIDRITAGITFRGANLWVLIFAIFIASLGLNVNSTAVIIGAMLISPLMGPIIGMGLAVGINDFGLFKKSFTSYAVATVISIITATVYFVLTPFDEVQSELLARTSPTLYDVLIAFCGGAAGILALSTKGQTNVVPGVAIATALMPPLCTAGFGLATGHFMFFLGAFYLFFINTVFICLATFLGVRMMKFRHKRFISRDKYRKVRQYIIAIVVATMTPAGYMTYAIVKESIEKSNVRNFIHDELRSAGTQIIEHELDRSKKVLSIVAVGKELTPAEIKAIRARMGKYHLADFQLKVYQGTQSDSMLMLGDRRNDIYTERAETAKTMQVQQQKIAELNKQLSGYRYYEQLSGSLRNEIKVLFPKIRTLSLSSTSYSDMDTTADIRRITALVGLRKSDTLNPSERRSLKQWLQARVENDSLVMMITNEE